MFAVRRPLWKQLVVATLLVAAATSVRLALQPVLGYESPFSVFYVPVILAAAWGGAPTAALAVLLSLFVIDFHWMEPYGGFGVGRSSDLVRIATFAVAATLIAVVFESLHRARLRAAEQGRRLAESERLRAAERRAAVAAERLALAHEAARMVTFDYDLANPRDCVFVGDTRDVFGCEQANLQLGPSWWAHLHPDDVVPLREAMAAAAAGTAPLALEYRWRMPDGTWRWLASAGRLLRDEGGGAGRLAGAIWEIEDRKRAELALRDSEQRFRATFEQAAVGIVQADPTGRFLRVNDRYCELLGYAPEELRSLTFQELTHPDDLADDLAVYRRLLAGERPFLQLEKRYVRKDGSILWASLTSTLVRDAGGAPLYTIGVIQDVGARVAAERALRESEQRFRQLADNLDEVFWMWDLAAGALLYLSPAAEAVYGIPRDDLLRNAGLLFERIHPEDQLAMAATFEKQIAGEPTYAEFRMLMPDGTVKWLAVKAFPIAGPDGRAYRVAGLSEDVTTRKRAEEDLRAARDAAEAASHAKSRFLANMSHEIRTPLNAILGFSELMLDPDLTVEDRINFVSTVRRNGKALAALIDDILDLSRVEADKLVVERVPVAVPQLVADVVGLLERQASAKGLSLSVRGDGPVPAEILSDPTRLRQILVNVLGNALKFTARGGVELIVRRDAASGDVPERLAFVVRDTGRGIASDLAPQLFQPFSQGDASTTRQYGGTGLGLALSKRLAGLLGGDVVLTESRQGVGSVFTVTVATGAAAGAFLDTFSLHRPDAESLPSASRLDGVHVLLVEDTPDNQVLIRGYLTRSGARVDVARDGAEGVERALQGEYDLVLMDLQMPRLDGYRATAALRGRGYIGPIVALTAHAMKEDRDRALAAGCDGHLTKPVSRADLLDTVARYAGMVQ